MTTNDNVTEPKETGQTVWVLYPKEDRDPGDLPDPWEPWYDKAFKFTVRAESEQRARELAQENAGSETRISSVHHNVEESISGRDVWTDPELVSCIPIEEYGEENSVLIKDFARA